MNNKLKLERMESEILRHLAIIVQREIKDEKINTLLISEVRLSPDCRYAKVYYSSLMTIFSLDDLETALISYKKLIRSKLAQKLKVYKCPELTFVYDVSLKNGNEIDLILKKIKD